VRGQALLRALAFVALLRLAVSPLGAEAAAALPESPTANQAEGPRVQAGESPAAVDSKAFTEAKAGLMKSLEGPDFESRLFDAADKMAPSDAASLEEFFAARVKDETLRKRVFARASELRLLLGEFAAAATDAEGSAPSGTQLLRLARLWLAAGETQRAAELAASVITSSKSSLVVDEARLVSAWASLISGTQATALALAGSLTTQTAGGTRRDALCREANFLIWAGGDAKLRETQARLLAATWPGSPEALIAGQSSSVALMALPHWYLGGLALAPESFPTPSAAAPASIDDKSVLPPPVAGPSDAPAAKQAPSPVAASGEVAVSSPPAAAEGSAASLPRFQIGIFSSRAHAQALVNELAGKGFVAKIETRKVGEQTLLAVVLFTKDNKDDLSARLKDAGYEVWLLGD